MATSRPALLAGSRRPRRLPDLLIILVCVATLAPLMDAGFLWDDDLYIFGNPLIRRLGGIADIWFSTRSVDYYPLSNSLLWLEWRLWDGNPAGYHLVNLMLHAATAVAVYRMLALLRVPGAWLAGVLFAVHPINVAAVGWPAQTKTLLAAFLAVLCLSCWIRTLEGGGRAREAGIGTVVLYTAALLAKTSVVGLPVVMILVKWWRDRKISGRTTWLVLACLAIGIALGLVTMWFQYHRAIPPDLRGGPSLVHRIACAVRAFWFYVGKIFFPLRVSWMYGPWEDLPGWLLILQSAGLLLVCGVMWACRARSGGRGLMAAWLSFGALMFPVLGLFDIGYLLYAPVADHWAYTGAAALLAIEAAALAWVFRHATGRIRELWCVVVALLVLALAFQSHLRARLFRDQEVLWRDAVQKYPRAWFAWLSLGSAALMRGDMEQARSDLEMARSLKPDWPAVWVNLGIALARSGDMRGAEDAFREAVRLDEDDAHAHYNLALLYRRQGRDREAARHLEHTLRILPFEANALQALADLLIHTDDPELREPARAIKLATIACEVTEWRVPGLIETLAECYLAAGRPAAARRVLERAAVGVETGGSATFRRIARRLGLPAAKSEPVGEME